MNTAEQLDDYGPWKFSEAPPEIQELAIENNRDINVDDNDWSECLETELVEDMEAKGITIYYNYHTARNGKQVSTPAIYFSGFYSQGDGACFEGNIPDFQKFLDAHFEPHEFKTIRLLEQIGGTISCIIRQTGRYCHSNSVSIDFDAEPWERCHDYKEDSLRLKALEALMAEHENELDSLEARTKDILRGYMDDYYKKLEEEYNYLTSDEAIREMMEANDYEIDEEGNIV